MSPTRLIEIAFSVALAGVVGCSGAGLSKTGTAGTPGQGEAGTTGTAGSSSSGTSATGETAGTTGASGSFGSSGAAGAAGGAGTTNGAAGMSATAGASGGSGTSGASGAGGSTWCSRGVDVIGATPAAGFCLKSFAQVSVARALAFAPNGDLFVSAPALATPGGASGGPGAIMLLSDDDHDGSAETHVFLSTLDAAGTKPMDVHGLALGGGYLYFTTKATVWRTPYVAGQRAAMGYPENLGLPPTYGTGGRWTHGLARSVGGAIYTSRGAYGQCGVAAGGDITSLGVGGVLQPVATGFRNPMYLRCHRNDEVCAAMELGEDLLTGATEKMLLLHPSTDYGFPCCTTKGKPSDAMPTAAEITMCNSATKEDATFPLSNTPFGFDWEMGSWPPPYTNGVFVALHGSAYSSPPWQGAAIVYAPTDPTTHAPVQDWKPFQGGFGPGGSVLDRPSDIAFAPDGRMFIADDQSGHVYWMAPAALVGPTN
jgi:glucose/arabinose dehydrogenase